MSKNHNETTFKMNPKQTIYQMVKDTALSFPKLVALRYMHHSYNYKHVLKRINQFAFELKELGIKKDEPVTVCLPNIPDAVYLLYAISQIGAIANLVHPLFSYSQMEENYEVTKSKYVFVLDTRYKDFAPLKEKGVRLFACYPDTELSFIEKLVYRKKTYKKRGKIPYEDRMRAFYHAPIYKEEDTNYLGDNLYLHSGGTSGKPKIVALSSFALNSICNVSPWIVGRENLIGSSILAVLPMFHGFGLCMGIHAMLSNGGTDVLMPKFSPKDCVKYIRKNELEILLGVPILYEALLNTRGFYGRKLRHLNIAFVGGDFVSNYLIDRFNRRMIKFGSICRLREGYGLTESVNVCCVNTHRYHKDNTVGIGLPCVKFKVIDPDTLEDLGFDKEGELIIGGDTKMNGYRFSEDPDINNKVFVEFDGEKYIRTGDFCSLDADNFVHFKTRLKRIIKVNGVPVFPLEIEDICQSFEFVFDAAVKGVEDAKHGHIVVLYIVLNRNFNITKEKAEQILVDKIVSSQGVYAKPKIVKFIDKMPHTPIGKVDINALD